jgi:hypothetical protein
MAWTIDQSNIFTRTVIASIMTMRRLDRAANSPPRQRQKFWCASGLRSFTEGTLIGFLIGLVDINSGDGDPGTTFGLYLIAGLALGFRNAGRASVCWPPLGVSLYIVHLIAIACGQKPPFVESDFRQATHTLGVYGVAGLGLLVGVVGRVAVNALGFFRRAAGPPVRFLPRTVSGWLFIVFCFGLGFWSDRLANGPRTVYAVGYDEFKFQRLRLGMTRTEVEAALGSPIQKVPASADVPELWFYSLGKTSLDDYWRRWVQFENGKVTQIISDYWED